MAKPKRKKRKPNPDPSIPITVRQLWEADNGIMKLLNSPKLNAVDAWRLRKLGPALQATRQAHFDLVREYAIVGSINNGSANIKTSDLDAFGVDWDAQLDQPLGIKVIPIPLGRLAEAELTPAEFLTLEFMIIDPEPPAPAEEEE